MVHVNPVPGWLMGHHPQGRLQAQTESWGGATVGRRPAQCPRQPQLTDEETVQMGSPGGNSIHLTKHRCQAGHGGLWAEPSLPQTVPWEGLE